MIALRSNIALMPEDYAALREQARVYLTGAWPGLSDADVADAVDEAVARVLQHRTRLDGLTPTAMLGYFMRVVRNLQIDRFRRARETPVEGTLERKETGGVDDVDILGLIDRNATLATVRAAIAASRAAGDDLAVDVAYKFMNLAAQTDATPTLRDIAQEVGHSHSTVRECLMRFRTRIPQSEPHDS